MDKKDVLLVDFDETIFPFSSTYFKWVKGHYPGVKQLTSKVVSKELRRFPAHLSNLHNKLHIETFVNSSHAIEIPPREDATESLYLLAEKYTIICCTSRRNMSGTKSWINKHYPDIIKRIEHVEDAKPKTKKISISITKRNIAQKTQAKALIDDFAFNMWRLPPDCKGFVVQRQSPIPSDLGALAWKDIVKCLMA